MIEVLTCSDVQYVLFIHGELPFIEVQTLISWHVKVRIRGSIIILNESDTENR